jgi:hypothetical protein
MSAARGVGSSSDAPRVLRAWRVRGCAGSTGPLSRRLREEPLDRKISSIQGIEGRREARVRTVRRAWFWTACFSFVKLVLKTSGGRYHGEALHATLPTHLPRSRGGSREGAFPVFVDVLVVGVATISSREVEGWHWGRRRSGSGGGLNWGPRSIRSGRDGRFSRPRRLSCKARVKMSDSGAVADPDGL